MKMYVSKMVLVVRARPGGRDAPPREDEFLEGTLSIGWPTKASFQEKSREEIAELWEEAGGHPMSKLALTQILHFVTLPKGSIVLSPSYETRDIHIFETTSGYKYVAENYDRENPHTIEAEHLGTVPRSAFSDIVQRALKAARRTVTNFSKYSDEILPLTQKLKQGKEIELESSNEVQFKGGDYHIEAKEALRSLLQSEDENIRLKAALALLESKPESDFG